jgi:hypothetical protein
MSYSTFIHSGIVNPANPKIGETDVPNLVTLDVSLLTKILDLVSENKNYEYILSNISKVSKSVLTLEDFDYISRTQPKNAELEEIKKLAGL